MYRVSFSSVLESLFLQIIANYYGNTKYFSDTKIIIFFQSKLVFYKKAERRNQRCKQTRKVYNLSSVATYFLQISSTEF